MEERGFVGPLRLAVSTGATTPSPGLVGAIIWSTSESRLLHWNGSSWQPLASSSAAVSTSAGASDAGKLVMLGGAGKVDTTLLPLANSLATSAPGLVPQLNAYAQLDGDMVTAATNMGYGTVIAVADSSLAAQGRVVALNSFARIDNTLLPSTLNLTDQAEVNNANATGLQLYAQNVAERRLLAASEPSAAPAHFFQPARFSSRISALEIDTAGNWFSQGLPAVTPSAGTESTVAGNTQFSTASTGAQMPRKRLTSGTTIGSRNTVLHSTAGVFVGAAAKLGGFHFVCRYLVPGAMPGNTEWFLGLASASFPSNIASSGANTMFFGVGAQSGDFAGQSVFSKQFAAAAGAYTKTSINASGSFSSTGTGFYELHLFCASGAPSVMGYQVRRLNVQPTVIVSGTVSTTGMTGQYIYPYLNMYLNTAGTAMLFDVVSYYLERDY